MATATVVFLVIGGVGLAILAFALLGGDIPHKGGLGGDGRVSLDSSAGVRVARGGDHDEHEGDEWKM